MGACMMAVPRVVGLGEEGVLSVSSKLQQLQVINIDPYTATKQKNASEKSTSTNG